MYRQREFYAMPSGANQTQVVFVVAEGETSYVQLDHRLMLGKVSEHAHPRAPCAIKVACRVPQRPREDADADGERKASELPQELLVVTLPTKADDKADD
jgi:hypothetical protein